MTKTTFDIAVNAFTQITGYTIDQIQSSETIKDMFVKFCAAAYAIG